MGITLHVLSVEPIFTKYRFIYFSGNTPALDSSNEIEILSIKITYFQKIGSPCTIFPFYRMCQALTTTAKDRNIYDISSRFIICI